MSAFLMYVEGIWACCEELRQLTSYIMLHYDILRWHSIVDMYGGSDTYNMLRVLNLQSTNTDRDI